MKWGNARRSGNIQDRRGMRMGGPGGLGIGGIAAVVVISLLLGENPLEMLSLVSQMGGPATTQQGQMGVPDDEAAQFVAAILGETEDVWSEVFAARGARYQEPTLVLFSGAVQSACGTASSAVGPFYCPGDHQVYIDLDFFAEMERSLGGGGDFAAAYVIAHEVGHHVQTLTGTTARVDQARRNGERIEGDGGLLVRQELQADCYAGLWAYHAQRRHDWLEDGDLEEALNTATAIGDDTLQRRSRGTVVPDSFSHGTAQQRVRWFRRGFESGELERCDTFAVSAREL
jgi:Predicted metalloprotease